MLDILPRPHPPSASVQTALLSAPLAPFIPEAIFFRSMPRLCSPWRKHRKSFRIRFLKIFKKAVCFSFISLWYWKIVSLDVDINCQKSGIWSMHISYSHYSMSWYNIILCMYIYIYIIICIIDILHPSEAPETVRHGTLSNFQLMHLHISPLCHVSNRIYVFSRVFHA